MDYDVECPGCGLKLPNQNLDPDGRYNASGECFALYGELTAYNMMRANLTFIHQLAVDAYGAQHAGSTTKTIRTAFSLIGLCLAKLYAVLSVEERMKNE